MYSVIRASVVAFGCLLLMMTLSVPAFGQASFNTSIQTTDLSGEWAEIAHEIGPYIEDAAKKQGIPLEAIKGGAATMYPEYREKLKTLPVPPMASN